MIKSLFKDSFVYSISTFLSKGIGIIMIPIYTRVLSPKEFGIVELITLFGTVLSIVLNLEIHQAVARFYPECQTADDKNRVVSTAFWFVIFTYMVFNAIFMFFYPQLSAAILNDAGYSQLFSLAIWALTFNFLFYFLQSQLIWQLRSKQNAISAIVYTILTAVMTATFLYAFRLGVKSVFLAQLLAAFAGICVSFYFARESYLFEFDFIILKRLIKFSLPLVPSTLAVYGMLYVDRYIINHYLSLNEVGLYSIAFKLASTIGIMTVGVQTALTPLIYTHYREPDTPDKIATLFRYFFLAGMLAITAISIFARDIMVIFTQPSYYGAAPLVPFLMMSVFFSSILNFSPGIFIKNKTILIVYINVALFLANVVLNIGFVKILGVSGAALATMLSSLLYFGLYQIIGNRLYHVPHPWRILSLTFACCCGAIAFIYSCGFQGIWHKGTTFLLTALVMSILLARSQDWKLCYKLVRGENV